MERDRPVIELLNGRVARRPRWGFWKLYDRSRLDGERINHKRLHRVYCAMKLNLPRRTKRKLPTRIRQPLLAPDRLNEIWALDFMADALYGGRPFRALNVIDEGNREVLGIEIATSIPASRVIRVMEQLIELYGKPLAFRLDNGSELTSGAFTEWCAEQGIELRFIQPGKPDQNAFSSSASTRPIAMQCWMPMCSKRWIRCGTSPKPGSVNTTRSGPTTASAGCRR